MKRKLEGGLGEIATENPAEEGLITRPDGLSYLSPIRAQAFLGLIRAGSSLAAELDDELESEHGLSLRAFEVLLFLAVFSKDGSLGMSQLIEHAPLSQSRVSRLVGELENKGLVGRSPAERDGRGVRVAITDQGLGKFRAAQQTHLSGLEQKFFSHLSETEIGQLAAICSKVVGACGG